MISTGLSDPVEEFIKYQMLRKTLTPLNLKLYLCSAGMCMCHCEFLRASAPNTPFWRLCVQGNCRMC